MRTQWTFHDDIAVINRAALKGRFIFIPETSQRQTLKQLHVNHMGTEKAELLVHESIYWTGMNNDTENHIKNCSTYLDFQLMQPKEK